METHSETPAGPVQKREVLAWAFYDFANSGYTTVVLTTIYSAFFVAVIAADVDVASPGKATLLWTLGIGAANLIVLVSGPVLGAIADYRATKKFFLLCSTVLCVAGTTGLAFAGPGQVEWALALLVIATVAFASGENLIGAFLPEITTRETMGKVSGYGWGLGYFGGLLTLACCLAYINWSESNGIPASDYIPVTLLMTAVIFAVTAAPTFLWLRERARPRPLPPGEGYLSAGFKQVWTTLRHASRLRDLFRFLGCLTVYQAGVATVVVVAAIYAQEVMGFDRQQLIILIMVVNLTAALGALLFGFVQDRLGSVPSLAGALILWIAAILVALLAQSNSGVWITGNLIGLAMGSTQAGGRALIGKLTPAARNAEIFGLWGLAARAAAIIGPVSYGVVNRMGGGDHQLALLSTLAFFVLGLLLLMSVNEARGVAAANAESVVT